MADASNDPCPVCSLVDGRHNLAAHGLRWRPLPIRGRDGQTTFDFAAANLLEVAVALWGRTADDQPGGDP